MKNGTFIILFFKDILRITGNKFCLRYKDQSVNTV